MQMLSLEDLRFDNQFTRILPADPVTDNSRRQVRNTLYSRVAPLPVAAPYLVAAAEEVAELMGLDPSELNRDKFTAVFSGCELLPGMDAHATCYGGHQFGNWAGQLGDGRAINLGEIETGSEAGSAHLMLQLKGAGPTPYSRTADGLAVMRSSVREFLCSEAMFHLGIPTTRALSLIGTGEAVMRDMLYDGNPAAEPGAVVCRVSSSFVRFGHFQMLAARQEVEHLAQLAQFVIQREFPHIPLSPSQPGEAYLRWFIEVIERTATLMVEWMRVGFVHGVMNTDNMSILGETIDYGPYGWLDDFDPDWTPNTTDAGTRRYRYGQQPAIGQWNLLQLANALLPLFEHTEPLEEALSHYASFYESAWRRMMANKLGLKEVPAPLLDGLHQLLTMVETDMTLFYRRLATVDPRGDDPVSAMHDVYYRPEQLTSDYEAAATRWFAQYAGELQRQQVGDRTAQMNAVNPKYVMRNYLAQLAIDDAERGSFEKVRELLDVMRTPYDDAPKNDSYAQKRPEWARTRVGCSMLSCSS